MPACLGGGSVWGRVRGILSTTGVGGGQLVRVPEMLAIQKSQGSLRLLLLTIAVVVLVVNIFRAPATFQTLCHTLYMDHFLNIPNCPIITGGEKRRYFIMCTWSGLHS